jgi:hypothetical protein
MANESVSPEALLKITQELAGIIQKQFVLVQAIQAVLIANDFLDIDQLNVAVAAIQSGAEVLTAVQAVLEAKRAGGETIQ